MIETAQLIGIAVGGVVAFYLYKNYKGSRGKLPKHPTIGVAHPPVHSKHQPPQIFHKNKQKQKAMKHLLKSQHFI